MMTIFESRLRQVQTPSPCLSLERKSGVIAIDRGSKSGHPGHWKHDARAFAVSHWTKASYERTLEDTHAWSALDNVPRDKSIPMALTTRVVVRSEVKSKTTFLLRTRAKRSRYSYR